VKIVVVDFSGDLIEDMSRVDEAINELDVGMLGYATPMPGYFIKLIPNFSRIS
jgi:hypothetical protein